MPVLFALRPISKATASSSSSSPTVAAPSQKAEKPWDDQCIQKPRPAARMPLGLSGLKGSQQAQSPARPIRPKQTADPSIQAARANFCSTGNLDGEGAASNYGSSGSAHEPSTVCLAAMVHEFMEDAHVGSCGRLRCNCLNGTCNGEPCLPLDPNGDPLAPDDGQLCEILEEIVSCTDEQESRLLADVLKALDASQTRGDPLCYSEGANCSNDCFLRLVMKNLRLAGYNAAVCKSRWEHSGGFPAGDYEYIDVIMEGSGRLIVDTNFRAQFEIARASSEYNALLQIVPCILVSRAERLHGLLKIMSEAAKRSLEAKGMHLPPWRKHWYLQAKWFSSYKRTTKESPYSQHCRSSSEETVSRELAAIALKGSEFCSKFKEEVEAFYGGKAAEREGSKMMSRLRGGGKLIGEGGERAKQDEIAVVMSTDWQPPAVNPRKANRVSGLADALKKGGGMSPWKSSVKFNQQSSDQKQRHAPRVQQWPAMAY